METLPSPWARESTSHPCHCFSAEPYALKTKRQAALRKLSLPKKRCRRNASRAGPALAPRYRYLARLRVPRAAVLQTPG